MVQFPAQLHHDTEVSFTLIFVLSKQGLFSGTCLCAQCFSPRKPLEILLPNTQIRPFARDWVLFYVVKQVFARSLSLLDPVVVEKSHPGKHEPIHHQVQVANSFSKSHFWCSVNHKSESVTFTWFNISLGHCTAANLSWQLLLVWSIPSKGFQSDSKMCCFFCQQTLKGPNVSCKGSAKRLQNFCIHLFSEEKLIHMRAAFSVISLLWLGTFHDIFSSVGVTTVCVFNISGKIYGF